MAGESFGLDGGGGDDEFEVGAARQQPAQVAEQEVDVEAAFVCFVEDEGVVAQQPPVALDLGADGALRSASVSGSVSASTTNSGSTTGSPSATSTSTSRRAVSLRGSVGPKRCRS
jgi:hypothetical protein